MKSITRVIGLAGACLCLGGGWGCIMVPPAPGPASSQTAEKNQRANTAPQNVGEAVDADGNQTIGASGVASTAKNEQTPIKIARTSATGTESSLVLQFDKDKGGSFITGKDYRAKRVEIDPVTGHLVLEGFEASASTPTQAMEGLLAEWVKEVKTWAPEEQKAFAAYLNAQAEAAKATGQAFAGPLAALAKLVGG